MDVRIVAATHVDLEDQIAQGEFREDLFYRLHVVKLTLPPLRERGGDTLVLAEEFVRSLAGRYELPLPPMSPEARAVLASHDWPGNVRELRHAIERALLLSPPGTLDPSELVSPPPRDSVRPAGGAAKLSDVVSDAIHTALAQHGGNKSAAARQLGISRQRLQRILDGPDQSDV